MTIATSGANARALPEVQLTRRLFLEGGSAAVICGALGVARATPLQPLTAAEYVRTLRDLGNRVGLMPRGLIYITNARGVKLPESGGEFDRRLKLWADDCRARGYRYVQDINEYLEAEEEDKASA